MGQKTVVVNKEQRICRVTMNRPNVMNAFDLDMGADLLEIFEQISRDKKISVVILTGAGDNFSSGADMQLLKEETGALQELEFMKDVSKLIRCMRELPQPIISKVRGVAYGVGANIALAGDFVIASLNARFCEAFVNIGLSLDGGGTYFLPRLVGLARARELALLGDEFDGETAESMGLIYRSVPDDDLEKEVDEVARKLSGKPFAALGLIKEGLEGSFDRSLTEALEWEAAHQSIMTQTVDFKKRVEKFIESTSINN